MLHCFWQLDCSLSANTLLSLIVFFVLNWGLCFLLLLFPAWCEVLELGSSAEWWEPPLFHFMDFWAFILQNLNAHYWSKCVYLNVSGRRRFLEWMPLRKLLPFRSPPSNASFRHLWPALQREQDIRQPHGMSGSSGGGSDIFPRRNIFFWRHHRGTRV